MEATQQKKTSEVKEQVSFCNNQIDLLDKTVVELEDRLSPIIKERNEEKEPGKDGMVLTPLANQIRAMGNVVNEKVGILRDIIERLEI